MKVLIAEDDVTTRRLLEVLVGGWGYEVISTRDGGEAWDALQSEDRPMLALVDWEMPKLSGMQVCEKLRAFEKGLDTYTYLIFLTSRNTQDDIIEGLSVGADDYVVKPFYEQELKVRLRAGARIAQLQADLVSAKRELLIQSRTDPLTGTLNRRALIPQIEVEIARAERENSPLAVSLLDIDNFKSINDTYGHDVGDKVLCECVKCIQSIVRPFDLVGRLGGEEFLIVGIGIALEDALAMFERIRIAIAEMSFGLPEGRFQITVSQGITSAVAGITSEQLMKTVDLALYMAKNSGRNCTVTKSAKAVPINEKVG